MKSASIVIEINIEELKDYHQDLAIQHYFLNKRNDLENVIHESVTFYDINNDDLQDILDVLRSIFNDYYKIDGWKRHVNNIIYLMYVSFESDPDLFEYRKQRKKQLRQVLKDIVAIRKLAATNKKVKSITIGGSLEIKGELTVNKAIEAIHVELVEIYNNNLIDDSFPKLTVGLSELQSFLSTKPEKSATSWDIAIGKLCYALKGYLDTNGILLSHNKLNFKSKQINLALSNDQGDLIAHFLILFKIIKPPQIQPHLRIRRFIETFRKTLPTQLQIDDSK